MYHLFKCISLPPKDGRFQNLLQFGSAAGRLKKFLRDFLAGENDNSKFLRK
jgi:hypothetical protein